MKTAITAMKTALKTLGTCALLALAALHTPAHAQAVDCEVDPNGYDVDFGTYQTGQGNATSAASPGAWRFKCKNGTPNVWNMKICVGLGEGSMGMLGGMRQMRDAPGNSLRYQLYRDPAASQPYDLPPDDDNNGIKVVTTLPPNSETLVETPFRINGRIPAGQITEPGLYESTFTSNQIRIRFRRYGITAPEPPCISLMPHNVSFAVRVQVLPFCEISEVKHVDFGTHTVNAVTGGINSGGILEFRCNANTVYSIALGNGQHAQGNQRRMRHSDGSANVLAYELYRDTNRTQRWGSVLAERQQGTATGLPQSYEIYARVPGGQTVTAVGAYKDTVVVTVHY